MAPVPEAEPERAEPERPEETRPAKAPVRPRGLFKRDMERQEQLLSFAGAVLAVILGLVGGLTAKSQPHTAHATTTVAPGLIIGLSSGLGLLMWLTARHGSRVATALVAMALFLTAFGGTILGIPYVGLGGWLLIRNSRTMREERMAAQKERGATGARGGTTRQPRPSRRARKEAAEAETRRIDPNKRYTPPAPRRRRPGR